MHSNNHKIATRIARVHKKKFHAKENEIKKVTRESHTEYGNGWLLAE
jgi:hypothetical protein